MKHRKYENANQAFEELYKETNDAGIVWDNTRCLLNIGFELIKPNQNKITNLNRKWKEDYAEAEWQWYKSGNRNAIDIAKKAKIWYSCMDHNKEVNSNYGWHWKQNDQIGYIINELKNNPKSRRACISIYDAKNRDNWDNDTPCTYAINFFILFGKLSMNVMMRSNDLWYGFCNDQYCFSKLMILVAKELNLELGSYYHFVNNMHVYNNFLNKKI